MYSTTTSQIFLPVPLFDSRQCQDWTLNFPEGLRMVNKQGALAMAGIQAPEEAHTNSTVRVGLDQTLVIQKMALLPSRGG